MPAEATQPETADAPRVRGSRRAREAATGAVLGSLCWIAWLRLGIPQAVIPEDRSFLPLAALLGAAAYATRGRRALRGLAAATAVLLFLIGFTPVMRRPIESLVRRDAPQRADAVVVLSSDVNDEGNLDRQGFDRLLGGMDLLRRGYAPLMVRTAMRGPRPSPETDVRRALSLLPRPVPVVEVGPVASTHDEAMAVRALYVRRGWRRILLVTSPQHTKRAAATFRKAGMTVVSVPAVDRDYSLSTVAEAGERWYAFRLWLYEEAAWAVYAARGWV